MAAPYYKRRRRSLVRSLWVYRRLVTVAIILGLTLWFVLVNNEHVTIAFPFRLGSFKSTTGLVILMSAIVGSIATALAFTVVWAIRKARSDRDDPPIMNPTKPSIVDDLPPSDYAAKTGEGLQSDARWS